MRQWEGAGLLDPSSQLRQRIELETNESDSDVGQAVLVLDSVHSGVAAMPVAGPATEHGTDGTYGTYETSVACLRLPGPPLTSNRGRV
jgi:hypothetical protein